MQRIANNIAEESHARFGQYELWKSEPKIIKLRFKHDQAIHMDSHHLSRFSEILGRMIANGMTEIDLREDMEKSEFILLFNAWQSGGTIPSECPLNQIADMIAHCDFLNVSTSLMEGLLKHVATEITDNATFADVIKFGSIGVRHTTPQNAVLSRVLEKFDCFLHCEELFITANGEPTDLGHLILNNAEYIETRHTDQVAALLRRLGAPQDTVTQSIGILSFWNPSRPLSTALYRICARRTDIQRLNLIGRLTILETYMYTGITRLSPGPKTVLFSSGPHVDCISIVDWANSPPTQKQIPLNTVAPVLSCVQIDDRRFTVLLKEYGPVRHILLTFDIATTTVCDVLDTNELNAIVFNGHSIYTRYRLDYDGEELMTEVYKDSKKLFTLQNPDSHVDRHILKDEVYDLIHEDSNAPLKLSIWNATTGATVVAAAKLIDHVHAYHRGLVHMGRLYISAQHTIYETYISVFQGTQPIACIGFPVQNIHVSLIASGSKVVAFSKQAQLLLAIGIDARTATHKEGIVSLPSFNEYGVEGSILCHRSAVAIPGMIVILSKGIVQPVWVGPEVVV